MRSSWAITGVPLLAFIACLAAGAFAGWLNGTIVTKIGIPSLVATIGTQFFWRGVVLVMRNGNGQSLASSKGSVVDTLLVGRLFDKIPAQFIWTIVIAIAVWFLLNRHRFGAHVYLTGDNEDSSRLMGINVNRIKILTFVIVGVAAAFSGLVQSLDVSYFWPTVGEGQLLNTLAAVFLGGTSVFGGTGTIFGTFVASFIIGAINAGIVAAGLTGMWTQVIYGLIIVALGGCPDGRGPEAEIVPDPSPGEPEPILTTKTRRHQVPQRPLILLCSSSCLGVFVVMHLLVAQESTWQGPNSLRTGVNRTDGFHLCEKWVPIVQDNAPEIW